MKSILYFTLALALLCLSVNAQTAAKSAKPAIAESKQEQRAPALTTEQQQRIALAVERAARSANEERAALQHAQEMGGDGVPQQYRQQATNDYLLAKMRREREDARAASEVYFVMAQLKVSPDEYELKQSQGGEFVLVKKVASHEETKAP